MFILIVYMFISMNNDTLSTQSDTSLQLSAVYQNHLAVKWHGVVVCLDLNFFITRWKCKAGPYCSEHLNTDQGV